MEIVRDIISKGSPLDSCNMRSPHYQSLKESPYWTQLWVLRTVWTYRQIKFLAIKTDLIASNFLKWKSGTGHTHQLTITHMPMNIIKSLSAGINPSKWR